MDSMKRGFSLVELSIVLVILGLMAGGVMAGRSIIRGAELRSIATDFERYALASQAFVDKFQAMPGDMENATSYWGAIHVTPATCITLPSPNKKATCNGTGDGLINPGTFYAPDGYERYQYWLHLSNAGLIEGNYTGLTANAGAFGNDPGTNVPKSRIRGGWSVFSNVFDYSSGNAEWFPRKYNHPFLLSMSGSSLTPSELWSLDSKLDDGKATYGRVFAFKRTGSFWPNCATSDTMTADYNVTLESKVCGFNGGFQ